VHHHSRNRSFSTASTILDIERYEENEKQASCIRRQLDNLFLDFQGLSKSLTDLRADGTGLIARGNDDHRRNRSGQCRLEG
jgi:hypothetical protein